MISRLKNARQSNNKSNANGNVANGSSNQSNGMGAANPANEIAELQTALSEAMLRERQLIQEQVEREDQMTQQKEAQKAMFAAIMKEKEELAQKVLELETEHKSADNSSDPNETNIASNSSSQSPPSQPPPPAPDTLALEQLKIEAQQNKEDLARVLGKLSQREHEHQQQNEQLTKFRSDLKEKSEENVSLKKQIAELQTQYRLSMDKLETAQQKMERATKDTERFHHQQTLLQSITNDFKEVKNRCSISEQEKENLKDELNEKKQVIEDLHAKMEQLTLQNSNHSGTIQELTKKLEDLTQRGKVWCTPILSIISYCPSD